MRWIVRWWKRDRNAVLETEKIKEQSRQNLEKVKRLEAAIEPVLRKAEELRAINHITMDIERSIGWKR
jgi:hypothetical protein